MLKKLRGTLYTELYRPVPSYVQDCQDQNGTSRRNEGTRDETDEIEMFKLVCSCLPGLAVFDFCCCFFFLHTRGKYSV